MAERSIEARKAGGSREKVGSETGFFGPCPVPQLYLENSERKGYRKGGLAKLNAGQISAS